VDLAIQGDRHGRLDELIGIPVRLGGLRSPADHRQPEGRRPWLVSYRPGRPGIAMTRGGTWAGATVQAILAHAPS
jgi:hypothetical protein